MFGDFSVLSDDGWECKNIMMGWGCGGKKQKEMGIGGGSWVGLLKLWLLVL